MYCEILRSLLETGPNYCIFKWQEHKPDEMLTVHDYFILRCHFWHRSFYVSTKAEIVKKKNKEQSGHQLSYWGPVPTL